MAKSVDDRGRGARLARRDEGAYCSYVTEEQRSQPGCIGHEGDRLSHSRALSRVLKKSEMARQLPNRLGSACSACLPCWGAKSFFNTLLSHDEVEDFARHVDQLFQALALD